MQQAIAVLDSGVGGLTVVKEVMRQLPRERIIYFGDTARAPYGPRPSAEVVMFTKQIVDFLLEFNPKMIVIACNTATALALDEIRAYSPVPVLGVIHPGTRAAIKNTANNVIGVIGTEGTIRSGAYEQAINTVLPDAVVHSVACPRLVPLVEKGLYSETESRIAVSESLMPLKDKPIDCLILGCTHYPFLSDMISHVMGSGVKLISSADETAREIGTVLYHRGQLAEEDERPNHQFFCSGDSHMFRKIAQQWLGQEISVSSMTWPETQII
ncbi:glutamate racemase [Ferviditalea candida]|uniref:Glutamate racemase n=1 Tax=Ferviditalea candida TaxID=3108399 RepID=A0ABU5ZCP8_9BACL|nr:glutamate racemase [Paenibacillaceae bacterium T2]